MNNKKDVKLIIDASQTYTSIALKRNNHIISHEVLKKNQHAESSIFVIQNLLISFALEVNEIQKILVGQDIGSFTGNRTSMGLAQSIAFGIGNCEVKFFNTLHLILATFLNKRPNFNGEICVIYLNHLKKINGFVFNINQAKIAIKLQIINESINFIDNFIQNNQLILSSQKCFIPEYQSSFIQIYPRTKYLFNLPEEYLMTILK